MHAELDRAVRMRNARFQAILHMGIPINGHWTAYPTGAGLYLGCFLCDWNAGWWYPISEEKEDLLDMRYWMDRWEALVLKHGEPHGAYSACEHVAPAIAYYAEVW